MLEPIRIVRRELKKTIGILNPHKHPSQVLVKECDFFKTVRAGVLAASQFPRELHDAHGTIVKPASW